MANTGVGGIKDSQGNYEIVGKSNSALGTRGGTLLVPVGDVIGQTSGTLVANVYTATTLGDASAVALNVQAFVPGSPPSPANVVSSLTMGVDATGDGVLALIAEIGTEHGVRVAVDAALGSYTTLAGATTWLDSDVSYPNKSGLSGGSALDAFFLFNFVFGGPTTRSALLPFDGQICDVIAQIFSAGDVDIIVDGVSVATLAPAGVTVRRATDFSPVVPTFTKGQLLEVTLAGGSSTAMVRVYYIRTGSVL